MRIAAAHIEGFRAIGDLKIEFGDLTAFVGTGGVGKSTILNALEWFFTGATLDERDLHLPAGGAQPADRVVVAVTFSGFRQADREALGRYATGSTTTLTRAWSVGAESSKLSGNALVHPDFEVIRASGKGRGDARADYVALFGEVGAERGYPQPARGWPEIEAQMEQWEREHPDQCELIETDAGRHLHGFAGTPLLASQFAYVRVGATAGPSDLLTPRSGSALDQLLSAINELNPEQRQEIAQVQTDAQERIKQLVQAARGGELALLSTRLTSRVRSYFPGSGVKLHDEVEEPKMPAIRVQALVSDRHGHSLDPERQGHGLQRVLVIALLHELAEALSERSPSEENGTTALMLAIEEPELYQHPLQARALADTLRALSSSTNPEIQIAYSTHSPYFTSPALFGDLRLCRRDDHGGTSATRADQEAIRQKIEGAGYAGDVTHKVATALADSLREAIFARAVLLTEGPTDKAVMQGVADLQGGLDADGVALASCGSKHNVGIAVTILRQLGIPFFALFDADAGARKTEGAELNRRLLLLCGESGEDWPTRAVRERSANFTDNLETDLEELWPAFAEARADAARELNARDGKEARVYRAAVDRAGEPPQFMVDVLDAVRHLAHD